MPIPDDDRLFTADERTRRLARALYGSTRALPIVSPLGHTDTARPLGDRFLRTARLATIACRTIWPFHFAAVGTLLLVTHVPGLSLWPPALFR